MRIILIYILCLVNCGLMGQNPLADKKIIDIDSFKKYTINKIDNNADLDSLSDKITKVTEMIGYNRESKTDLSGKVTEKSTAYGCETNRTYYFNDKSKLFAIIDNNTCNTITKKLIYYFGNGKLTQVIDENKNDVTSAIDKEYLYYWIKRMFNDQTIVNE